MTTTTVWTTSMLTLRITAARRSTRKVRAVARHDAAVIAPGDAVAGGSGIVQIARAPCATRNSK